MFPVFTLMGSATVTYQFAASTYIKGTHVAFLEVAWESILRIHLTLRSLGNEIGFAEGEKKGRVFIGNLAASRGVINPPIAA